MDNYQDYVHLIGQRMDTSELCYKVKWDFELLSSEAQSSLKQFAIELGLLREDVGDYCWEEGDLDVTEEYLKCVLTVIDNDDYQVELGGGYALFAISGMILNKALFGK